MTHGCGWRGRALVNRRTDKQLPLPEEREKVSVAFSEEAGDDGKGEESGR